MLEVLAFLVISIIVLFFGAVALVGLMIAAAGILWVAWVLVWGVMGMFGLLPERDEMS